MKVNFLKTVILKNKRRRAVIWSSLVCFLLLGFTLGAAQPKTPKRITALQLGDAAEGARVTIVSDSALSDYEAFRRGDRFYVRIPLADFTSIPPTFRADGFEDVQVQKVGDSLLVSFRLQPGATAHVDQRPNRLDVIFAAPNRALRNRLANGTNRVLPSDRGPDAAGPMPPGTMPSYSRGTMSYGAGVVYGVTEGRNPRLPFNPSAGGNRSGNNQFGNPAGSQSGAQSTSRSTFGSPAGKSPSPFPSPMGSPSSILSPSNSNTFPPATGATPATSGSFQPALSASPAGPAVASGTSSWRVRGDAAMKWISANRLATLLGALILLALIVYLVMALGRRRKSQAKAKRLKAPKVQPKVEPNFQPDIQPTSEPLIQPTVRSHEPSYSPALSSQPREYSSAPAGAVASGPDRNWVRKPSTNSPASPGVASGEEQEREVFEL